MVMPPPPMPEKARAAISWPMFCDRPQRTLPRPKTAYAKRRHDLREKMSESFPYRGWKEERVRKYLEEKRQLEVSMLGRCWWRWVLTP